MADLEREASASGCGASSDVGTLAALVSVFSLTYQDDVCAGILLISAAQSSAASAVSASALAAASAAQTSGAGANESEPLHWMTHSAFKELKQPQEEGRNKAPLAVASNSYGRCTTP